MTEKEKKPKEKEPTVEEQIKLNVKKTLEDKFIQNVVGSNNVKSNPFLYGQLGIQGADSTYENVMFGEEANKLRKTMYDSKKSQGDKLGVYGDPSLPSNYDVSMQILQQVQEVMALGKLGDLESHVKAVANGFDFSVPDKLKNYSVNELMVKLQKGEKLNDDEKMALNSQNLLNEAYTRAVALNACQSNYFSDLNMQAKQITDFYKPKEAENKEEK
jgi:hypothetical protein